MVWNSFRWFKVKSETVLGESDFLRKDKTNIDSTRWFGECLLNSKGESCPSAHKGWHSCQWSSNCAVLIFPHTFYLQMEWVCSAVILIDNLLPLLANPNTFIWGENTNEITQNIPKIVNTHVMKRPKNIPKYLQNLWTQMKWKLFAALSRAAPAHRRRRGVKRGHRSSCLGHRPSKVFQVHIHQMCFTLAFQKPAQGAEHCAGRNTIHKGLNTHNF